MKLVVLYDQLTRAVLQVATAHLGTPVFYDPSGVPYPNQLSATDAEYWKRKYKGSEDFAVEVQVRCEVNPWFTDIREKA